jgi:hypothetical protein
MLPSGERFNRDFFIDEVSECYDEHRSETKKEPIISQFLHIDKALPHLTQSNVDSMGIHLLPHPPNSLDVAPYDFWLSDTSK